MPASVDLTTLSDDLPVFLQNGIGVGYSAIDVRRAIGNSIPQEGAAGATDFLVSQRAGGAGMAVDVAAGRAYVLGDTVTDEGKYLVRRGTALTGATEITATPADGANPRIDQVILEVKNDVHDGSGLNRGRVRYVAGTPTAGATLANRLGAAALPNTAIRLADVLMPAAAANVPTANIADRRPQAFGGRFAMYRNAAYSVGVSFAKVPLDTIDHAAPTSWVDLTNNRFVPQTPGSYQFSGRVWIANTTDGVWLDIDIRKNGASLARARASNGDPTDHSMSVTTDDVQANGSTDFFELWASCEGIRSVSVGRPFTALEGHYVGP